MSVTPPGSRYVTPCRVQREVSEYSERNVGFISERPIQVEGYLESLAITRPFGHTADMSEREDYADNDLPRPRRPSLETAIVVGITLALLFFIFYRLLLRIIVSRMEWS